MEIILNDKCPKCGSKSIVTTSTLMMGPGNTTTYHCIDCGYSWKNISNVESVEPVKPTTRCILCEELIYIDHYDCVAIPTVCDRCKKMWKEFMVEQKKK